MELHGVRETLELVRERNNEALRLLTAALDGSLQYAYAQLSERTTPGKIPGAVLAANVRINMVWYGAKVEFQSSTLSVLPGVCSSVAIHDRWGQEVKLRKHPRVARIGSLQGVAQAVSMTLFGPAPDTELWDIAVLWDPDVNAQALSRAWLTAVDLRSRNAVIFDKLPLDTGPGSLFKRDEQDGMPDAVWETTDESDEEGFDDFFEDGDDSTATG